MADLDCATFLMASAELAAGVIDEPDRSLLFDHAETCPSCRSDLDGMADAVDRLVVLAPAAEPPPGFEAAVLRGWAEATDRSPGGSSAPAARPRLAALAAAAVVTLAVGVALGRLLGGIDPSDRPVAEAPADLAAGQGAKPLTMADGTVVGSMFLDETDPKTLVMVLTRAEPGERYRCLLVDAAGGERELGSWTGVGWHGGSWSIPLPPDAGVDDAAGSVAGGVARVVGVALRDEDGVLVASGSFA
jgi:hypothetical protein